ncbi:hypothetical protein BLOT_006937 [Blomia tropicalis]|nr:hypothetical protein BLOT_006937 [Blomia tropicalis]
MTSQRVPMAASLILLVSLLIYFTVNITLCTAQHDSFVSQRTRPLNFTSGIGRHNENRRQAYCLIYYFSAFFSFVLGKKNANTNETGTKSHQCID